jgi:putative phosphoribosyl transferase
MDVTVSAEGVPLPGIVGRPSTGRPAGWVVFAHGSGSSRLSPRNQQVARSLEDTGFATLLFDLLTAEEDKQDRFTGQYRFDIGLLTTRLTGAVDWLLGSDSLATADSIDRAGTSVGLFGASTGAAAALVTAAQRPAAVGAVVSRGGRPDLAGGQLGYVKAPTLLIVGQRDEQVISLNVQAAAVLTAPHQLAVVPEAGHLFEEPGAIDQVSDLASAWFRQHLARQT